MAGRSTLSLGCCGLGFLLLLRIWSGCCVYVALGCLGLVVGVVCATLTCVIVCLGYGVSFCALLCLLVSLCLIIRPLVFFADCEAFGRVGILCGFGCARMGFGFVGWFMD